MKIIIASQSNAKLDGISLAFREMFPKCDIEFTAINVDSGVGRQPFNNDVFLGAKNRVENIPKSLLQSNYDFLLGCEGGIIEQFGNYFNLQVVYIKHSSELEGWGISQGLEIPKKYISKVKESSIKVVLKQLYGTGGGVGTLSDGIYSRRHFIKEATKIALCSYNWL